jgi:prepilin-type N-terminal cleavage/methylation domain-containing protein
MTPRRGFTLIEMLVAIVVAVGIIGTARALVNTIGDAGIRLASAARGRDEAVGGELMARSIIRQARRGPGDAQSFFGTRRGFVVQSWCPVAGGWSEPCEATFAVDDSTASLVMRPGRSSAIVVAARGRGSLTVRYLVSVAGGGRWMDRWFDDQLPLAVGILVDADTLIVPVGR